MLLLCLGLVPIVYVLAVAIGRTLKRRQHVPLGIAYQFLCLISAIWFPLWVYLTYEPDALSVYDDIFKQFKVAMLIFGVLFVIALMRRFLWQVWFERKYHIRAPKFITDLSALLLFALALILAFSLEKGQPITGIAVGSTLVAAILGLALQDLLGNIIAGVSLEIGKPFKAGDWLVIEKQHMEVVEVNWRSTRLRTNDDIYLDIPNRTIAGSIITNLSLNTAQHALRIQVAFDMELPPNFVKDCLRQAAGRARGVLTSPPPKAYLNRFGDYANIYEIKFWIDDETQRNDILDAVNTNVWYEAQRSQMRMPYPIQNVRLERRVPRHETSLEAARVILRRQPFLQMLDEPHTDRLLRSASVLRFGRGERFIDQGAQGESMFIILTGEADVYVRLNDSETKVGMVGAGEYCGEMSLLTGEPRSASVVARTDCEVWEIERGVLGEILQENRSLVQTLSDLLAQRRMENEGVLATSASQAQVEHTKKAYADSFLRRLSSFFEL